MLKSKHRNLLRTTADLVFCFACLKLELSQKITEANYDQNAGFWVTLAPLAE
jgi:hypothetical protein